MGQDVRRAEPACSLPQVADLGLLLYDRPLHPELLPHFADYRLTQTRYVAHIWICGLGHVVTVSAGNRCLAEVIAVDSDDLPTRGVLTRFKLKGERDLERRAPEGWSYMISTQVEQMDEPLYKSVHTDLVRHAIKRGCFYQYDQWSDGDLSPFTYIDYEARDAEFHVHAFHTFPQERHVVKTQTIFELGA